MRKPPGRKPLPSQLVRTVLTTPSRVRTHDGTCGITMTGMRDTADPDGDAITLQLEYSHMTTQEMRILAVQFLCFLEDTFGEGFVTSCVARYAQEMGHSTEPTQDTGTRVLHLFGLGHAPLPDGLTEESPVPGTSHTSEAQPVAALPTTERLARAMEEAGAGPAIVARARAGYYDEFRAPDSITFPILQLVYDALKEPGLGTPFAKRVQAGEFDATQAEMDAWAASAEGQHAMQQVMQQQGTARVSLYRHRHRRETQD